MATAASDANGSNRRAAIPPRIEPDGRVIVNAAAAAPASKLWARARVFMYTAVGLAGSAMITISVIDSAANAAAAKPTVRRDAPRRAKTSSTTGHTR